MGDDLKWRNKQGYLNKMGFERQSWKKRYFVLEKNVLKYYDSDNKKKLKGQFSVDFLSLDHIIAVPKDARIPGGNAVKDKAQTLVLKKSYLIQIGNCKWNDTGLRTFFVHADTEADQLSWLDSLVSNAKIYAESSEGREDEQKQPPEGERREAYAIYMQAKKAAQVPATKPKTMKDEPWFFIHNLCSRGTVLQLEEAVAKGADLLIPNPNGGSTLLQAATYGNIAAMEYLLKRGLPIDGKSKGGNTALHAAATMGHQQAASLLLSMGADRSLVNNENKTAAQAAKTSELGHFIESWSAGGGGGEPSSPDSGRSSPLVGEEQGES